ncbi:MAG: hypothetical protein J6X39_05530 [Bacteroidales bacterium]|nr:hypothetical protein [Bacteroidales bacterium]
MRHLFTFSVIVLLALSSCVSLLPEEDRAADLYASMYDFEYVDTQWGTQYLVPVAHNKISAENVMKTVKGEGWKTTALYKLNPDKEVLVEYVLVTGDSLSSSNHEASPNYIIFSNDGKTVNMYELHSNRYDTEPFEYDSSNNVIYIPSIFSSWQENGRLVYLSNRTMVCVCTRGVDYRGDEIIYMEILQRVSNSERKSWIKSCPVKGLKI